MNEPIFILQGDICYSRNQTELEVVKHGYVICKEGVSLGVYEELPAEYKMCIRDRDTSFKGTKTLHPF